MMKIRCNGHGHIESVQFVEDVEKSGKGMHGRNRNLAKSMHAR